MTIGLELHRTGTVEYIPIGEGFYGIVCDTDDGYQNLYPVGLYDEYKVDGLRISFVVTTREDYYAVLPISILQWGVPVEILSISHEVPQGEEEGEGVPGEPAPQWYKNPLVWVGAGAALLLFGGFGKKIVRKRK